MKTLYTLSFLMLLSISTFSQESALPPITAKGLWVINKTDCTQYFVGIGYDICRCNEGGDAFQSEVPLAIAPNTQIYYDYNNLGGDFSFNEEKCLALVRIAGHPMEQPCYNEGTIGQPCSGEPSLRKYVAQNTDCKPCKESEQLALTIAEWIPAQNCKQDATLLFTNQ